MIMSPLEKLIAKHEGLKLKPYRDSVGKLTIGYGRNLDDVGLTPDECLYLLKNNIDECRHQLEIFPWFLKQPYSIKMALLDMCYNLGITRLLTFKKMIKALSEKNYTQAAIEALNSKWAEQVGERAKDIAVLIRESNAL